MESRKLEISYHWSTSHFLFCRIRIFMCCNWIRMSQRCLSLCWWIACWFHYILLQSLIWIELADVDISPNPNPINFCTSKSEYIRKTGIWIGENPQFIWSESIWIHLWPRIRIHFIFCHTIILWEIWTSAHYFCHLCRWIQVKPR